MDRDLFGICPYVTAQRLLQGKWSILVMHHLSGGPVRFNELQRRLPRMTHATLSRQLKQMESDGLIVREDLDGTVPCVQYRLSGLGERFLPALDALREWGQGYIDSGAVPSAATRSYVKSFE